MFIVKSNAVVPGIQGGQFDAEFRGRTPKESDQLVEAMKDKVTVQEGAWTTKLLLTFNTQKKPFDDVRVRQALTMAIDRWGGSEPLAKISMLKFVGGFMRPGSDYALPEDELVKLPGYDKDIAKSREEAKKLLAEAGVTNLKINFVNRNIAEPYRPAASMSSTSGSASASRPSTCNSRTSLFRQPAERRLRRDDRVHLRLHRRSDTAVRQVRARQPEQRLGRQRRQAQRACSTSRRRSSTRPSAAS